MASKSKRPYRKRKRAASEEETRRRITEAAVEMHGTVGPANTKVTELAERAGVSRMTVYNHFPTEVDLFRACSSHWAAENPFPDPERWLRHQDPRARLGAGLAELYVWYDQKQDMLGKVLLDAPRLPSLREFMEQQWAGFMDGAVDALARGWSEDQGLTGRELRAALRLAVDFNTWRLLTDAGITPESAAELFARMILAVEARS